MNHNPFRGRYRQVVPVLAKLIAAARMKTNRWRRCDSWRKLRSGDLLLLTLIFAVLVGACASFGPYHANTPDQPFNSIRGPKDGRDQLAFIEFGDQGSSLDNSQRKAALEVIRRAERPLLFVYIHGWQNNAASGDVCRATENRAFEANITRDHPDYSFYTSEHNDGHENRFCHNGNYNPDEARPPTGRELWRRWQFVYAGNARVPCWIVRVPKDIIWGHGGLWSDNSVAMLAALFRIQFPLPGAGNVAPPPLLRAPKVPDLQQ